MVAFLPRSAWDNPRHGLERSMVRNQLLKPLVLVALAVLGAVPNFSRAADQSACGVASESCLASCKRFELRDPKLAACNNFCRKKSVPCPEVVKTPAAPEP